MLNRGGRGNRFLDALRHRCGGFWIDSQKSKIVFLNVNWQRNVDRTQEAELIIAQVQRSVDGTHITWKKPELAERNIQPAASTTSVWKHGCSCFHLEDHWASDIKFFTQPGKSKAIYTKIITTLIAEDLHPYSVVLCFALLAFQHFVQKIVAPYVEMRAA